jgi:energy-coupling factor transporter ATP-binding protein EcfA2
MNPAPSLSLSEGARMNTGRRWLLSPAGRRSLSPAIPGDSSPAAASRLGSGQIDVDDFLNAIHGGNRAEVHQYMQSLMGRVSLKNMVDDAGNTALHVAVTAAVSQGRTDIFMALVQYPIIRALVVDQNNDQKTPLDVANEWPDSRIKDVIVSELKVIDYDERGSEGQSSWDSASNTVSVGLTDVLDQNARRAKWGDRQSLIDQVVVYKARNRHMNWETLIQRIATSLDKIPLNKSDLNEKYRELQRQIDSRGVFEEALDSLRETFAEGWGDNVPDVFVSYAWEKSEDWVRNILVPDLRRLGLRVIVDVENMGAGTRIALDFERQIEKTAFVLVVCTPTYKMRANEEGTGVANEMAYIKRRLQTNGSKGVISLLRAGDFKDDPDKGVQSGIPDDLLNVSTDSSVVSDDTHLIMDVRNDEHTPNATYENLYTHKMLYILAKDFYGLRGERGEGVLKSLLQIYRLYYDQLADVMTLSNDELDKKIDDSPSFRRREGISEDRKKTLGKDLVIACNDGLWHRARLLIEENASVTERAKNNGYTALHFAAREGKTELVEALLANNADPLAKDYPGEVYAQTPIDVANAAGQRGIVGLMDPQVSVPDLGKVALNALLANPKAELTADQRLACLSYCMALGQQEAKKVAGQSLVLLIGNTGCGKSTLVNYLAGCDMAIKYSGLKEQIVVKADSQQPEVTEIGHDRTSKTFLPKIVRNDEWVYCDCPGFLDNRGAEINIANAVNIRQMVAAAGYVRVVVLVEYDALLSQRGAGLAQTMTMVTHLLGGRDSLKSHSNAIIMSVTKLPANNSAVNLTNVKAELMESCRDDTTRILAERLVIFDPLNREITDGQTRDALRHTIHHELAGITNLDRLFSIHLLPSDKEALKSIANEISNRIQTGLRAENYDDVRRWLGAIDQLNCLENDYVRGLRESVFEVIKTYQKDDWHDVVNCVGNGLTREGELIIERMVRRADGLMGYAELLDLEDMHLKATPGLDKQKVRNLELTKQMAQIAQMRSYTKNLKENIAKLQVQDELFTNQLKMINRKMEGVKVKYKEKQAEILKQYELDKEKLKKDIEQASKNDRIKIEKKLEALEALEVGYREKVTEITRKFEEEIAIYESNTTDLDGQKIVTRGALACFTKVIEEQTHESEVKGLLGVQDEEGLYRELGDMYAGSKEWGKLGLKVDEVPEISERMLAELEEMRVNGEAPLVVLDIGTDLLLLHNILERKAGKEGIPSNAKLYFWSDDVKQKFERSEAFATKEGKVQYLVVATGKGTSGTGVFDSTRKKGYKAQQKELKEVYEGYEEMRVREVVVMEILGQLANGKELLSGEERAVEGLGGRKCKTWVRTSEKWAGIFFRVVVGAHDARGLRVSFNPVGSEWGTIGLAASRKFLNVKKCIN